MKKKLLCLMLAALMLTSVCAFAEGETTEPEQTIEPEQTMEPEPDAEDAPLIDVDATPAPSGNETIEIPAELDGVFQFGDFYGEQLGIDFDRMMPARAPAYISKDDNGELTTEKRNIFIVRLRDAILNLTPSIDLSDLNINYVKDGANIKGLNAAVSAVLNSVPECAKIRV